MIRSLFMPALAAAGLAAQTQSRVVPSSATRTDGNAYLVYPFTNPPGPNGDARFQLLLSGSAFAKSSAMLTGFAFRVDAYLPYSYPAATVQNLNVRIGHAKTTPATMSTTFASNWSGPPTTVFSGNYSLPAQQSTPQPAAPFNIAWKLSRPFAYSRSSGDLLIELEFDATGTRFYTMDATTVGGNATGFGTSGTFATWQPQRILFGVRSLQALLPGGSVSLSATTPALSPLPFFAIMFLGVSNTSFGPIQLPLDLTRFGAPGNNLYTSMDLVVPVLTKLTHISIDAALTLPIPNRAWRPEGTPSRGEAQMAWRRLLAHITGTVEVWTIHGLVTHCVLFFIRLARAG